MRHSNNEVQRAGMAVEKSLPKTVEPSKRNCQNSRGRNERDDCSSESQVSSVQPTTMGCLATFTMVDEFIFEILYLLGRVKTVLLVSHQKPETTVHFTHTCKRSFGAASNECSQTTCITTWPAQLTWVSTFELATWTNRFLDGSQRSAYLSSALKADSMAQ